MLCHPTSRAPGDALLVEASRAVHYPPSAAEDGFRSLQPVRLPGGCSGRCPINAPMRDATVSLCLSRKLEEARDDLGRLLPFVCFRCQLPTTPFRDPVELRFAIVIRQPPVGRNRAFLLKFREHRIKSSLIDSEQVRTCLLNSARDSVSMLLTHALKRLKNHQSQRTQPDVTLSHLSPVGLPSEYGRSHFGKQ